MNSSFVADLGNLLSFRRVWRPPTGEFVRATLATGPTEVTHLNGVPWYEAPLPPRIHACYAQTRGWVNYFDRIDRCACGAVRRDRGRWMNVNERTRP